MTVHIDHATTEVVALPEADAASASDRDTRWEAEESARTMQTRWREVERRTAASGFDD